ncbi:hypothetical protein Prudu_004287 [Prunus dulcis]|uniref:Uncharacterized protein n=1 Tax=Prunus dulcis TaxID=3755 RepID=A0A4Y1QV30_PRUDU|nr:hypothetical protein Prudu_004287 [Prunus dulcis]
MRPSMLDRVQYAVRSIGEFGLQIQQKQPNRQFADLAHRHHLTRILYSQPIAPECLSSLNRSKDQLSQQPNYKSQWRIEVVDAVDLEEVADVDLPNVKGILDPDKKINQGKSEEENLVNQSRKFQKIWKGSPFYLEQTTSKERQNTEVERYSDRLKPKTTIRRGALFDILELKGFPQELTGGSRAQQPGRKRVRWNPDSELQKLDLFEKLEQRQGNNDGKEKKEGEGEDEDEEEEEEEPEEDFSDDDYQKNQDFDDDDDDFNMEDDGDALALTGKDIGLM